MFDEGFQSSNGNLLGHCWAENQKASIKNHTGNVELLLDLQ